MMYWCDMKLLTSKSDAYILSAKTYCHAISKYGFVWSCDSNYTADTHPGTLDALDFRFVWMPHSRSNPFIRHSDSARSPLHEIIIPFRYVAYPTSSRM